MACEICGKEDNLVKAKIEGAVLEVCKSCAEAGEIVEKPQKKTKKKPKKRKKKSKSYEMKEELVRNFDKEVKSAREDKGLSMKELAEEIKEKESVIKRIEQGKLNPSKDLAKKLERTLEISLYEKMKPADYDSKSSKSSKEMTIGDVADIKK